MATAAVQVEEEALVRAAIATVDAPAGVRLRRINLDYVDSTGDLAIQVIFAVTTKIPLAKARVRQLRDFKRQVAETITELGLPKWPFVNYVETR